MAVDLKDVAEAEMKAIRVFPEVKGKMQKTAESKRKIFIVSDLHGIPELYNPVFDRILGINNAHGILPNGSTIIFNGDCIGARGEMLNKIAKAYYDYKDCKLTLKQLREALDVIPGKLSRDKNLTKILRDTKNSGEFFAALAAISEAFLDLAESDVMLSSGEFLSRLFDTAKKLKEMNKDIKMIVLSGNSENVTICDMLPPVCANGLKPKTLKDFALHGIAEVETRPKSQRFRKNFFNNHFKEDGGVLFVDGFYYLEDILLVGAGVVEKMTQANRHILKELDKTATTIVCHYPPILDKEWKSLMGMSPQANWNTEENEVLNLVAVAQEAINARGATANDDSHGINGVVGSVAGLGASDLLFADVTPKGLAARKIRMIFGSYHPALVEEELARLNKTEKFSQDIPENDSNVKCVWIRPGVIWQVKE